MKSILDPEFRYVPAHETDIRKTFAKARRKIAAEKAKQQQEQQQTITLFRSKRNDRQA